MMQFLRKNFITGMTIKEPKINFSTWNMRKTKALSVEDKAYLERRIAESEKLTGVQMVMSVIQRCDSYPEIPWKAFAAGTSITGCIAIAAVLFYPVWPGKEVLLLALAVVPAGGLLILITALLSSKFARLLTGSDRMKTEAGQYAGSLFLENKLSGTPDRKGILIMAALFERQVVIIPDTGLEDRMDNKTLLSIIERMSPLLRRNDLRGALDTGLNDLVSILGYAGKGPDLHGELPDQIIERKGE